jgi:hypothetical protein
MMRFVQSYAHAHTHAYPRTPMRIRTCAWTLAARQSVQSILGRGYPCSLCPRRFETSGDAASYARAHAHPRPHTYACGRTLVARSSRQTMIGGGGGGSLQTLSSEERLRIAPFLTVLGERERERASERASERERAREREREKERGRERGRDRERASMVSQGGRGV